jgi:hypothetical protein
MKIEIILKHGVILFMGVLRQLSVEILIVHFLSPPLKDDINGICDRMNGVVSLHPIKPW